jgi:UDP-glucose 4-epimerase
LSAISESSAQSAPQEMNIKVNPYIPSKIIYNKILQKVSKHDKQRIEQLRLLNSHLTDQQFI